MRRSRLGAGNPFYGRKHTAEWLAAHRARVIKWTEAELVQIQVWYAARRDRPLRLAELAQILGRTKSVVSRKARDLGLTETSRKTGRKKAQYKSKYATPEEKRAAHGARTRANFAKNGHPRGMKGKKQKPEVLARARAAAAQWRANASPEQLREVTDRMLATRLAKHGTLAPSLVGEGVYSRCRSGRRNDVGGQFFRSMWEANYARFLNWMLARGNIAKWEYEAETFWFERIKRGVRSYKPDFRITGADGAVWFVEVKGWMDPKSKTKIKRMAKYHPTVDLRVFDAKAYRELARMLGPAIPGWETDDRGRS